MVTMPFKYIDTYEHTHMYMCMYVRVFIRRQRYIYIYNDISRSMTYRYSGFLKALFTPLGFYERPTLVPVFAIWKKSELDIRFYKKKGENQEFRSVFVSQGVVMEAASSPWQQEWHHQASFPGTTPSISASSYQSSERCLWASALISIDFVHVSAKCVLR